MKKIYIVVDACSGQDYSCDDPTILFVSENKKEAKQFFADEISGWEEGMENYESNVYNFSNKIIYECVDFNGDTHRIIKLVTEQI